MKYLAHTNACALIQIKASVFARSQYDHKCLHVRARLKREKERGWESGVGEGCGGKGEKGGSEEEREGKEREGQRAKGREIEREI